MYLPKHFDAGSPAFAAELIRSHPLASLIGNDDAGSPFVTHLPLHLDSASDPWRLLGHVALGNPHWRYLKARPAALASFLGPHAYMSPSVYPDLARVPTWNYLAVHCQVNARLLEGEDDKEDVLKRLIAEHDPPYAAQWQDLPRDFKSRMLGGIVAFELTVLELQCKLKLNQHRPEAHAGMRAAYAKGNESERALVGWMDRLGMHGPATS